MDNSTESTASLIEEFVRSVMPDVEVVQLPSGPGIFRFDDNVSFVNTALLPILDEERRQLADRWDERWQSLLHITFSLAAGAPARIAAISASLRSYRPGYLHLVELKHFWESGRLTYKDVDALDFDKVETTPARPVEELDEPLQQLVRAMREHYQAFARVRDAAGSEPEAVGRRTGDRWPEPLHDLDSFWMRKSKQPVLAVLLVGKKDGGPVVGDEEDDAYGSDKAFRAGSQTYRVYRGVNLEVSLPTGSLCSERAAIASALAHDPSLLRKECAAIAVLSTCLWPRKSNDPTCREVHQSALQKKKGEFPRNPPTLLRSVSAGSASPPRKGVTSERVFFSNEPDIASPPLGPSSDPPLIDPPLIDRSMQSVRGAEEDQEGGELLEGPVAGSHMVDPRTHDGRSAMASSSGAGHSSTSAEGVELPRARRQPFRPSAQEIVRYGLNKGIGGSDVVRNPLPPCGSCAEWLRKIAEVNPDFKVLTFTDTSCSEVYVRPVAQ